MSDSSQLPLYSITLNDTMASTTVDTITLTSGSNYFTTGAVGSSSGYIGSVTLNSNNSFSTISNVSILDVQPSLFLPTEWADSFPDWNRIQDMCEKYPGLKIAFENFKTFYCMVKDDYDNPKDET